MAQRNSFIQEFSFSSYQTSAWHFVTQPSNGFALLVACPCYWASNLWNPLNFLCLVCNFGLPSNNLEVFEKILSAFCESIHRQSILATLADKGVPCSSNKGLVVVFLWHPVKPLGSSPDAWLALKISCSVFQNTEAGSVLQTENCR